MVGAVGPAGPGYVLRAGRGCRQGRDFARRAMADQTPGRSRAALHVRSQEAAPSQSFGLDLSLLALEQAEIADNKAGNVKGLEYAREGPRDRSELSPAYVSRAMAQNIKRRFVSAFPGRRRSRNLRSDLRLALALDPSNADAHAGLIWYFANKGQWAESSAEIDGAVRDNPTNTLVLANTAIGARLFGATGRGRRHSGLGLAPRSTNAAGEACMLLASAYFYGRKFDRVVELIDQVPEESRNKFDRFYRAASYAYLGRAEEAKQRQSRPHRQERRTGDGDMVERRREVCADERAGHRARGVPESLACASAPLRRSSRKSTTQSDCRSA